MHSNVLSLIALCSSFRHFLHTKEMIFDLNHSTNVYTKMIQFLVRPSNSKDEPMEIVADSAENWFSLYENKNIQEIYLDWVRLNKKERLEEIQTCGFANGCGRWILQIIDSEDRAECWELNQSPTHPEDPDSRIWTKRFYRTAVDISPVQISYPSLDYAVDELKKYLQKSLQFSCRQDFIEQEQYSHSEQFEKALNLLEDEHPLQNTPYPDLIPPDEYPLKARQLLAANIFAFNFRGMGSWNDMSFKGAIEKDFVNLSDDLYGAINMGTIIALSSYIGD